MIMGIATGMVRAMPTSMSMSMSMNTTSEHSHDEIDSVVGTDRAGHAD